MEYITKFSIAGLPGWSIELHDSGQEIWMLDTRLNSGFKVFPSTTVESVREMLVDFMSRYGGTPDTIANGTAAVLNVNWAELFVPKNTRIEPAPTLTAVDATTVQPVSVDDIKQNIMQLVNTLAARCAV